MISNLQFYGATALVGFVLSLAFRKEAEVKGWMIWSVVLVPLAWAGLGAAMIYTIGDQKIEGVGDIFRYFDARHFYGQHRILRVLGVLAVVSTIYFALLFNLVWRIKNQAYPAARPNAAEPSRSSGTPPQA